MSSARLFWYCASCGDGPYNQEIFDFCSVCNHRQDGYSQDISFSLPEPTVRDVRLQRPLCPHLSSEALTDSAGTLPPPVGGNGGFQGGGLETNSSGAVRNPSHKLRNPDDSVCVQEQSMGLVEKCIFNLPDRASRPWVSRSRTVYPGQSCFSLETGKPAVAPKRRSYSPVRKAEVAIVRGKGACEVCRKSKKACRHGLRVCQETRSAEAEGSEPLLERYSGGSINRNLAPTRRFAHVPLKQVPGTLTKSSPVDEEAERPAPPQTPSPSTDPSIDIFVAFTHIPTIYATQQQPPPTNALSPLSPLNSGPPSSLNTDSPSPSTGASSPVEEGWGWEWGC
ncbi:hypothetical protein MMC26_001085 [Xylographa opegraphella]|nr:hypothetical protein [Xylographa opegraphella]